MQTLTKSAALVIGQQVYTNLYAKGYGAIVAIHGEQSPESVRSIAGIMQTGGSAEFDIIFEHGSESRQLPESILRGVQWEITGYVYSADEIHNLRVFLDSTKRLAEEEKAHAAAEFAAVVTDLRADPQWAHLQQVPDGESDYGKIAIKNIRQELKKLYPGVKFSVCTRGNSINITHPADLFPPSGEGEEYRRSDSRKFYEYFQKYQYGTFDAMTDCAGSRTTPWGKVFGSARYIFTRRDY